MDDLAAAGLTAEVDILTGTGTAPARTGRTFADVPVGAPVLITDSAGQVAVAVNRGDAAALLRTAPGQVVTVRSRPDSGDAPP